MGARGKSKTSPRPLSSHHMRNVIEKFLWWRERYVNEAEWRIKLWDIETQTMYASSETSPNHPPSLPLQMFVDNEKPTCKNVKYIFQLESRWVIEGSRGGTFWGETRGKFFWCQEIIPKVWTTNRTGKVNTIFGSLSDEWLQIRTEICINVGRNLIKKIGSKKLSRRFYSGNDKKIFYGSGKDPGFFHCVIWWWGKLVRMRFKNCWKSFHRSFIWKI